MSDLMAEIEAAKRRGLPINVGNDNNSGAARIDPVKVWAANQEQAMPATANQASQENDTPAIPGQASPVQGTVDLQSRIDDAAARGVPLNTGNTVGSIDPKKVWASSCLPKNAIKTVVRGKDCYVYDVMVESIHYEFALMVDGADVTLYVKKPDITYITKGEDMHRFHTYGQGKICSPKGLTLSSAYAAGVMWAAAYNRYLNTGSDSGFRLYDK
jgi:hypothetical protein